MNNPQASYPATVSRPLGGAIVKRPMLSMCAFVAVLVAVTGNASAAPGTLSYGPTIFGMVLAQSADPQPPELPKPPAIPSEAEIKKLEAQKQIEAATEQTIHLLDVLHQKGETKLRVRESGGVEMIYGEDGEPISTMEADERAMEKRQRSSTRKENARLGFSIGLFLFISYLILRGQSGRMLSR